MRWGRAPIEFFQLNWHSQSIDWIQQFLHQQKLFSILYKICLIRRISWINLEPVNHDWRLQKAFLCLPLTLGSFWYSGYNGWLIISRIVTSNTGVFVFRKFKFKMGKTQIMHKLGSIYRWLLSHMTPQHNCPHTGL